MALALGLGALGYVAQSLSNYFVVGSLFNRSDTPNVSYSIDTATESIRFTTARAVEPGEELCIRYSHDPSLSSEEPRPDGSAEPPGGSEASNHVLQATHDPNGILPDDDLPFTRVKLTFDEDDEETAETVRTGEHVPRSRTRLLMPNRKYSTGMGSRHPRPTTNNLRTEVGSPPSSVPHPNSQPSQMAQILRPRHADPRAPQARPQVPHLSALFHPPHSIPNSPRAPHRPPPALPAPRPAQRSTHPCVPRAQKHALADSLRPAPQGRA